MNATSPPTVSKLRTPGRALVLLGMLASSVTACIFDPNAPVDDFVATSSHGPSDPGSASDTGVVTTTSTTTMGVVDPSSTSSGSSTGTSEAGASSSDCLETECGSCVEQLCGDDPITGDHCGTCEVIGWPALGTGLYQAMMSDVMFGHPLELFEGGRLVDLSVNVSGPAQGSHARLLVYSVPAEGTPVLVVHTEPLPLQDGTNTAGVDDFVQDPEIHLEPGWYWLMVHFDAVTSLLRSVDGSDHEQVFESLDFDAPVPAELARPGSLTGHRYFISGTLRLDEP